MPRRASASSKAYDDDAELRDCRSLARAASRRGASPRRRVCCHAAARRCACLLNLLPHLVNGITLGLLFALIALGFMLIVG